MLDDGEVFPLVGLSRSPVQRQPTPCVEIVAAVEGPRLYGHDGEIQLRVGVKEPVGIKAKLDHRSIASPSTTLSDPQLMKLLFGLLHPPHVLRTADKQQSGEDFLYEG